LAEVDWDELTRLGLYDPAAANADERRALLAHYAERDVPLDVLVEANDEGRLVTLLGDRGVRPSRDLHTSAQLAERSGLDIEVVEAALRAAGLPVVPRDQPHYGDGDIIVVEGFRLASELFGTDDVLAFVRAMGMAASQVATGAVHLAAATLTGPLRNAGGTELERSQANEAATLALDTVPPAWEALLRHHAENELRRQFLSELDPGSRTASLAVGFLDLVGFTTVSSTLTTEELAGAVGTFERVAGDVVASHGARLVKVIGDEVMLATHDPAAACAIADEVVARFDARGGITYGPVLTLDGDYYGTGVNLAARAVAAAEPGQVLVDRGLADAVPGRVFASAGRRELKGFPEPVELFALRS
jgi:class 3 adenylate cyclase